MGSDTSDTISDRKLAPIASRASRTSASGVA
jgi:hypothetical protein